MIHWALWSLHRAWDLLPLLLLAMHWRSVRKRTRGPELLFVSRTVLKKTERRLQMSKEWAQHVMYPSLHPKPESDPGFYEKEIMLVEVVRRTQWGRQHERWVVSGDLATSEHGEVADPELLQRFKGMLIVAEATDLEMGALTA